MQRLATLGGAEAAHEMARHGRGNADSAVESGTDANRGGILPGGIKAAHDDFKRELQGAGFTILFDELDAHDSEVSWKGQGRSGQVALREECGRADKIYVKITNRPA